MAKTKTKTYQSNADGPIRVTKGEGRGFIEFVPGEVRTYETDDPVEQAALEASSDVSVVKAKK